MSGDPKLTGPQLAMLRNAAEDDRWGSAFVGRGQGRTADALMALGYGVVRRVHRATTFYIEDAGRERLKREDAAEPSTGSGKR